LLYATVLTVPRRTPQDRPVSATITVKHPVLTKIGVYFPPGCAGEVKVAIFYGRLQVWPAKEGVWVAGDALTVWDEPFWELPHKETDLRVVGCSPEADYDHGIHFYLVAMSRAVGLWMLAMARLSSLLEALITRLIGVPAAVAGR